MERQDDARARDGETGDARTHPARELSPLERRVLDVAKDMMQKHYTLNTVDLHRRATRELKDVTPHDIAGAIHTLLMAKVFFEGKALLKENVLLHPTRRAIVEMVSRDQAIHFSGLRDALDLDSRSLIVHLAILLRHEFMRVVQFGNKKAYYPFFSDKTLDAFLFFLHDEHVAATVRYIIDHGGAANVHVLRDQACQAISDAAFTRRVKRLIDHDILVMIDASTVAIAPALDGAARDVIATTRPGPATDR